MKSTIIAAATLSTILFSTANAQSIQQIGAPVSVVNATNEAMSINYIICHPTVVNGTEMTLCDKAVQTTLAAHSNKTIILHGNSEFDQLNILNTKTNHSNSTFKLKVDNLHKTKQTSCNAWIGKPSIVLADYDTPRVYCMNAQ